MDPFSMVAAIVFFGCISGLVHKYLETKAEIAKAQSKGSGSVQGEIQALREEVRQLREQNADLILSFDTTLQRLGAGSSFTARPDQQPVGEPATLAARQGE